MRQKVVRKKTAFIKKEGPQFAYIQGLSFEKAKEPDKFRAIKTRISSRKASKTGSGNTFSIW